MRKCKTKTIQADLGIFKHSQAYSGIIQAYSEPCETLEYSTIWFYQNLGIFRTWGIFKTLSKIYDGAFYENSERLYLFSQYQLLTFFTL